MAGVGRESVARRPGSAVTGECLAVSAIDVRGAEVSRHAQRKWRHSSGMTRDPPSAVAPTVKMASVLIRGVSRRTYMRCRALPRHRLDTIVKAGRAPPRAHRSKDRRRRYGPGAV